MDLISRELKWGNKDSPKTETVFFRELTAGEALSLTEGQTYTGNAKTGVVEIDVYANARSAQRLVVMSLVDADGKSVYTTLKALHSEPAKKVAALAKLAQEVHKDDSDDEDEKPGNG